MQYMSAAKVQGVAISMVMHRVHAVQALMGKCTYVHVYACTMYVCMYVCTYIKYIIMYVYYVHMYVCTYITHLCMQGLYAPACMYVCTYIRIMQYMSVCSALLCCVSNRYLLRPWAPLEGGGTPSQAVSHGTSTFFPLTPLMMPP